MIEEFLKTYKDGHEVFLNDKERDEIIEEIERLNNIINELEKWLYERSEYTNFGVVIDKLQELKRS